MQNVRRLLCILAVASAVFARSAAAQTTPRVLAHPRLTVDDRRADEVRHYRSHHELLDPSSGEWAAMVPFLRTQILVSAGLSPSLPRTPLRPVVASALAQDDVLVQKVYFESMPGWYVTGNLYRPLAEGVYPAVLSPHGHWKKGRLQNDEIASVPARAIQLARLGFVVFSPDMVGYNDSYQIPHEFATPVDALWGLGPLGLQLWDNIRSLDFLQSLDCVDPLRIACTGASGGATQTILLSAVDDRVQVTAPVNMVSLNMHGGCACENAPSLRLFASNVEIAALTAPRPMLLVSAAGDWTRDVPQDVAPWLDRVYERQGASNHFASILFEAEHNYDLDSREAVYGWFTRWLQGDERFVEERLINLDTERLRVWPAGEIYPVALELAGLRRIWAGLTQQTLQAMMPRDSGDLAAFRTTMLPMLTHALGFEPGGVPSVVELGPASAEWNAQRVVITDDAGQDQVPALSFEPQGQTVGKAVLLVHEEGIAGVFASSWRHLIPALTGAGFRVLVIDAFGVGEHNVNARDATDPLFSCYNRSDSSLAIEDVVLCTEYLRGLDDVETVTMVGMGTGALWALVAAPLAEPARVLVDVAGFDSGDDAAYLDRFPLPLVRRWGDFTTCGALLAPRPLAIYGTNGVFDTEGIAAVYDALDAHGRLEVEADVPDWRAFATWLLGGGS